MAAYQDFARRLAEPLDAEPPEGLLDRIKAEIPPVVEVGTKAPGGQVRPFPLPASTPAPRRQRWLLAASYPAGKLTVIHRTEYFEAAQTLFRGTVENFAAANNAELDISTTNPEAYGDFLGKMTAAVQAGNPQVVACPVEPEPPPEPDFSKVSEIHLDPTTGENDADTGYSGTLGGRNAAVGALAGAGMGADAGVAEAVQRHVGPGAGQRPGDTEADAGRRAGDDGGPAGKLGGRREWSWHEVFRLQSMSSACRLLSHPK